MSMCEVVNYEKNMAIDFLRKLAIRLRIRHLLGKLIFCTKAMFLGLQSLKLQANLDQN